MALGFFRRKRADTGKDPCTSPVYGEMADKQTKYEALVHALHGSAHQNIMPYHDASETRIA